MVKRLAVFWMVVMLAGCAATPKTRVSERPESKHVYLALGMADVSNHYLDVVNLLRSKGFTVVTQDKTASESGADYGIGFRYNSLTITEHWFMIDVFDLRNGIDNQKNIARVTFQSRHFDQPTTYSSDLPELIVQSVVDVWTAGAEAHSSQNRPLTAAP